MSQELDYQFYTSYYDDLRHMSEDEAINHWNTYGRYEGRFPNRKNLVEHSNTITFDATDDGVEYFYTNIYKWPTEFTTERVGGKTAVVFSGQLRTFDFCKHFITRKLFQNLESYDIYCLLCDTDDFERDRKKLEEAFGEHLKMCISWDSLPSEWKEFELDTARKIVEIHKNSDYYKSNGIIFPFPVNRPIQRRTWLINSIPSMYDNLIVARYDHIPTANFNPTILNEYDVYSVGDYYIMGKFETVAKVMNHASYEFLAISERAGHRFLHWSEYFLFTSCSELGYKIQFSDVLPPPRSHKIVHREVDVMVYHIENYGVYIPTLIPDNIPEDFDYEYYANEVLGNPCYSKIACLRHWVWHGRNEGRQYKRT